MTISASRRRDGRRVVTLLGVALLVAACHGGALATRGGAAASRPDSSLIRRDVAFLASDALEGRRAGTPGNDSAATYIARRFAELRLRPLAVGYLQPFVANDQAAAHAGKPSALSTQNVFALVPGRDPHLRGQYVVIGAHFDHLGRSTDNALDPGAGDAIRHGADDNASGTAAVLELARLLADRPTRRSVLVVAFSGEEEGLLGSQYFVDHSPVPLDSVVAMLNFDMVGRLREDKLLVYGVGTAKELPALLDSANAGMGAGRLKITALGDGAGPSDQTSFYLKNMPVLFFFTDLHEDYHRATDVASKIDAGGEARVVDLAERVLRRIADGAERLTFVRGAPTPATMSAREGSNVYLGSIPDMGAVDVKGMRLSGVSPGSPADQAGLRQGDVIVEFAGKPVKDLYEYSAALYAHQPGDEVDVVVMRGAERKVIRVKLGARQ